MTTERLMPSTVALGRLKTRGLAPRHGILISGSGAVQ